MLWDNCDVTAVELDPDLARMYQERFPNDTVIVGDAHQYLLEHYNEFDFIWASPPCPSHSRARYWSSKGNPEKVEPVYPDMKLYQEIIFLEHFFDGKWVVENVIPYYEPLLNPRKIGRHLFWSNFVIPGMESNDADIKEGNIKEWSELHQIDVSSYSGKQRKDKILRNLVHFDTGKHIFDIARGIYDHYNNDQGDLFNQ